MHPHMAGGMQQNPIGQGVIATIDPMDNVVVMPPRNLIHPDST